MHAEQLTGPQRASHAAFDAGAESLLIKASELARNYKCASAITNSSALPELTRQASVQSHRASVLEQREHIPRDAAASAFVPGAHKLRRELRVHTKSSTPLRLTCEQ